MEKKTAMNNARKWRVIAGRNIARLIGRWLMAAISCLIKNGLSTL
jgi:hypothetical protein